MMHNRSKTKEMILLKGIAFFGALFLCFVFVFIGPPSTLAKAEDIDVVDDSEQTNNIDENDPSIELQDFYFTLKKGDTINAGIVFTNDMQINCDNPEIATFVNDEIKAYAPGETVITISSDIQITSLHVRVNGDDTDIPLNVITGDAFCLSELRKLVDFNRYSQKELDRYETKICLRVPANTQLSLIGDKEAHKQSYFVGSLDENFKDNQFHTGIEAWGSFSDIQIVNTNNEEKTYYLRLDYYIDLIDDISYSLVERPLKSLVPICSFKGEIIEKYGISDKVYVISGSCIDIQNYLKSLDSSYIVSIYSVQDGLDVWDEVPYADLEAIGFDVKKYKRESYTYPVERDTEHNALRAIRTGFCVPNSFMYNKQIANEVFGTDDPKAIGKLFDDWDKFVIAAEKLKKAGYYITVGDWSIEKTYRTTHSQEEWDSFKSLLSTNEYIVQIDSDKAKDKKAALRKGNVFGTFPEKGYVPEWSHMDGKYWFDASCEGPCPFEAGNNIAIEGTYAVCDKGRLTQEAVEVLERIYSDEKVMRDLWLEKRIMPNNKSIVENMIADDLCSDSLREEYGYNPLENLHRFSLNLYEYPHPINAATITVKKNVVYDGKEVKPPVTVRYNGQILQEGKDYVIYLDNNRNVGKALAEVDGIGDYKGITGAFFEIQPRTISVSGLKFKNKTYDGSKYMELVSQIPTVTGVVAGDRVTVKTKSDKYVITGTVNAGSKYRKLTLKQFELTGKDAKNYKLSVGTKVEGTIKKCTLKKATLKKNAVDYSGSPQKPVLTQITEASGKKVLQKNCTITYLRNGVETKDFTSRGEIQVLINGKGNYKGTLSLVYTIK